MAKNISHWLKVQSRWFKNYTSAKKCFLISFWIFQYCFYYSFILYYCAIFNSLNAGFFSISLGCQTVWIQIRPDILSGLVWVQTVCKGYQQMTKVAASWQKVIKNNFLILLSGLNLDLSHFHWAPTFSIWLKCWLQQILSQGKP